MRVVNQMAMEITEQCNCSCLHCYNIWHGISKPRKNPSCRTITEFVSKTMSRWPMKKITLIGGEPTIHPEFGDIVRSMRNLGLIVDIVSNGTFDYLDCYDSINEYWFSTYSHIAEHHDSITDTRGSFGKLWSNIDMLASWGKYTAATFVMLRPVMDDLPELLERSIDHGVNSFVINAFLPGGRGLRNRNLSATTEELDVAVSILNRYADRIPIYIQTPMPRKYDFSPKIIVGECLLKSSRWEPIMDCAGNFRPCLQSSEIIGNCTDGIDETKLAKYSNCSHFCPAVEMG